MDQPRKRLPPLDFLVAFEAAARHLSFTKAARELHITQAAVSRQIRILEEHLGLKLFDRQHRSVRLTPEGLEFQHTVAMSLAHVGNAVSELRARGAGSGLTVATDQSIAALWLVPRLREIRDQQPAINLRLIASDNEADCLTRDVDVAILHGKGDWHGFESSLLLDEEVFPVCSPDYLRACGAVRTPADLLDLALVDHEDDRWTWINWRVWFTENGVDLPAERHSLGMNNYPLVIQAACAGQGLALGWRYLVDDLIAQGALVRPIEASVRTSFGYYLVWLHGRPLSAEAEAFCAWVKAACRAQQAAPE